MELRPTWCITHPSRFFKTIILAILTVDQIISTDYGSQITHAADMFESWDMQAAEAQDNKWLHSPVLRGWAEEGVAYYHFCCLHVLSETQTHFMIRELCVSFS